MSCSLQSKGCEIGAARLTSKAYFGEVNGVVGVEFE